MTSVGRDIPSEVPLGPQDGMPRDCAVNCDHLQRVAKARLGSLVTTLSRSRLADVSKAVSFALDL